LPINPLKKRYLLQNTVTQERKNFYYFRIDLNLHTCFNASHYALDQLRRNRGHIINFASSGIENLKAWPMPTGYCTAKMGVAALTESLAVAMAPDKVRA
ncbi:MAG: SDR family NAD(P)-dependent oxidoreductase, partial [Methylobacter sp.]